MSLSPIIMINRRTFERIINFFNGFQCLFYLIIVCLIIINSQFEHIKNLFIFVSIGRSFNAMKDLSTPFLLEKWKGFNINIKNLLMFLNYCHLIIYCFFNRLLRVFEPFIKGLPIQFYLIFNIFIIFARFYFITA